MRDRWEGIATGLLLLAIPILCVAYAATTHAHVPYPKVPIDLRFGDECPVFPNTPDVTVRGCVWDDPPRTYHLWFNGETAVFWHEVGHVYDRSQLKEADRDLFKQILGLSESWYAQPGHDPSPGRTVCGQLLPLPDSPLVPRAYETLAAPRCVSADLGSQMTRLIGLLSFYEESPPWLSAAISSVATRIGLDHLVVLDGAYQGFPSGLPFSAPEQHEAVINTARACGASLNLFAPRELWPNEMTKRDFLFRLGDMVAEPGRDWFIVFDADEVVSTDLNARKALAETEMDAAEATLWWRASQEGAIDDRPLRVFYRAVDGGIHVRGNHCSYYDAAGRCLWGNDTHEEVVPAADLTTLRIEHRSNMRDPERAFRQQVYYQRRQQEGFEFGKCKWCDETAVVLLPFGIERTSPNYVRSGHVEVCPNHMTKVIKDNNAVLTDLGLSTDEYREKAEAAIRQAGYDPRLLYVR